MREQRSIPGVEDGTEFTKLKASMSDVGIDKADQVKSVFHEQLLTCGALYVERNTAPSHQSTWQPSMKLVLRDGREAGLHDPPDSKVEQMAHGTRTSMSVRLEGRLSLSFLQTRELA